MRANCGFRGFEFGFVFFDFPKLSVLSKEQTKPPSFPNPNPAFSSVPSCPPDPKAIKLLPTTLNTEPVAVNKFGPFTTDKSLGASRREGSEIWPTRRVSVPANVGPFRETLTATNPPPVPDHPQSSQWPVLETPNSEGSPPRKHVKALREKRSEKRSEKLPEETSRRAPKFPPGSEKYADNGRSSSSVFPKPMSYDDVPGLSLWYAMTPKCKFRSLTDPAMKI
jgi:hypothetical protein|mmetsp:Transcript_10306/g.34077  ORF Transcript_10306/g.34077 Transcript_10306/m.34077 type:complete len:223 (-) Transcript_10306:2616-3284(-)